MIPDAILEVNKKKTANLCVIFIPDGDYYWMNEKNLEFLDEEKLDAKISKISKANVLKYKEKLKSKSNHRNSSINDAFLATKGLEFDDFMDQLSARLNKVARNVEVNEEEDKPVEEEEEEEEEEADAEVEEEESVEDDTKDQNGDAVEEENQSSKRESRLSTRNGKKSNNSANDSHLDESNLSIKEDVTFEESSEIILNGKNGIDKQSDDEVTRKRHNTEEGEHNSTLSQRSKRFKTESPGPVSKVNNHKKELTEEERLQQLWLCRIKLQKSLIQRDNDEKPNADELSTSRLILKKLVDFKINLELLKTTKIHKVLKCIIKDKSLEFPESFKLHDQCQELLTKWAGLIEEIKLEKTADYLNKQRKLKSNDDANNNEINDTKVDESVKSPTELKYASVES